MALHNPVEDAQRAAFRRNPLSRQALDVAQSFLADPTGEGQGAAGGTLPAQASPTAQSRAFGQQGATRRRQRNPGGIPPGNVITPVEPPSPIRAFLGGSEQPNRDLLRRVMQRVFQTQGRRF